MHDFGHTPFGHTGEEALDAKMAAWGGFDHNAQSLRIVTRLERRYAEFDGLNLTWETLEGLVKHNGPLIGATAIRCERPVPQHDPRLFNAVTTWSSDRYASLEAQCAAIADDIAYNTHDIDDGLRAGLLTLEMLAEVPLVRADPRAVRQRYPGLDAVRTGHELMRRQITAHGRGRDRHRRRGDRRSGARRRSTTCTTPGASWSLFSAAMAAAEKALKAFLYANLYRHPDVMRVRAEADGVVRDLFDAYFADPSSCRKAGARCSTEAEDRIKARHVADFLAGMTDTYALKEHRRLFDHTPDLG